MTHPHRLRRLGFAGAAFATLVAAAGCNIIGAVAAKTVGNPDIPAKYVPEKKPTLVWVENFQNPDQSESDAQLLSRILEEKLKKRDLMPIVPMEKAIDVKNLKPKEFRRLSVAGLGREVGAEQVLYVSLQSGGLVPLAIGGSYQGRASVQVKMIRTSDGATLWPTDMSEGYPLTTETNPLKGTDPKNASTVRINLYEYLADDLVRLFYKHDPDEIPVRQ